MLWASDHSHTKRGPDGRGRDAIHRFLCGRLCLHTKPSGLAYGTPADSQRHGRKRAASGDFSGFARRVAPGRNHHCSRNQVPGLRHGLYRKMAPGPFAAKFADGARLRFLLWAALVERYGAGAGNSKECFGESESGSEVVAAVTTE